MTEHREEPTVTLGPADVALASKALDADRLAQHLRTALALVESGAVAVRVGGSESSAVRGWRPQGGSSPSLPGGSCVTRDAGGPS